jgi:hypothetical protein
MTLSILRHYTVGDRIIDEYGEVGGTQIGRETKVFGGMPLQCYVVQKFHITSPGFGHRSRRWEARD